MPSWGFWPFSQLCIISFLDFAHNDRCAWCLVVFLQFGGPVNVFLFATENKLELHKQVCENKNFCSIRISSKDTKILKFNQYQKSDKAPFIIYGDLECLIEKIDGCKNNPESSSTTKVGLSYSIRFFNVYNIIQKHRK